MNLFTKQKQTYRVQRQTYCYQRGNVEEPGINKHTLLYIKQGVQDGEHVHTRGRFMLMYSKTNTILESN